MSSYFCLISSEIYSPYKQRKAFDWGNKIICKKQTNKQTNKQNKTKLITDIISSCWENSVRLQTTIKYHYNIKTKLRGDCTTFHNPVQLKIKITSSVFYLWLGYNQCVSSQGTHVRLWVLYILFNIFFTYFFLTRNCLELS